MNNKTKNFMSGAEAYREIKKYGILISYPTAIKRLLHDSVAKQPAGTKTGILVSCKRLCDWIEKEVVKNKCRSKNEHEQKD